MSVCVSVCLSVGGMHIVRHDAVHALFTKRKEKIKQKNKIKMTGDGLHVVRHDGFHTLLTKRKKEKEKKNDRRWSARCSS